MNERRHKLLEKINGSNLVLLPPQKPDYTPRIIMAIATIVGALIVSKRR